VPYLTFLPPFFSKAGFCWPGSPGSFRVFPSGVAPDRGRKNSSLPFIDPSPPCSPADKRKPPWSVLASCSPLEAQEVLSFDTHPPLGANLFVVSDQPASRLDHFSALFPLTLPLPLRNTVWRRAFRAIVPPRFLVSFVGIFASGVVLPVFPHTPFVLPPPPPKAANVGVRLSRRTAGIAFFGSPF